MAAPLDPRLLHESRSVRRHLTISVALAAVTAAATAAFAILLARVLAGVITDPSVRALDAWTEELTGLTVAAAVRVTATWAQQRLARAGAGEVVDDLRARVARAVAGWDPIERRRRSAELDAILTTGLGGLVPYLAGYVPALTTAVVVTPALVVVVALVDPLSAVVIAVTLPLIPVFMILVGTLTRSRTERQLQTMSTLSARVLDLIAGVPTLVALGRERGPEVQVAAAARAHRRATMDALRIAFLSSMVLELLATLCVALVAVGIGLRLVVGDMDLAAGIAALILAPEVYQPLRAVGARFHESADGALAADRAFEVLDGRAGERLDDRSGRGGGGTVRVAEGPARIEIEGLEVRSRDGMRPAGLDLVAEPGHLTVLTGPNGSGKSTAILALLALLSTSRVEGGRIRIGGIDVEDLDRETWWSRVAWQPQSPTLVSGTLRENVELFGVDPARLDAAARLAGADRVVAEREEGWDSPVGPGGGGLSTGEAHRLALTRLFAADADVLVADEPTAHLDGETAGRVADALRDRARSGSTVLVVSHAREVLDSADVVVTLTAAGTPAARPEVAR
ncbi:MULTISPECIES: thiol reductant ABC exporter subunit CydD [unclassified Dietzia]|uniref:thiol reductant ABC exporter subunit CydD n=1 Tax=unclassified Dietzia TaxID=2617939 RepID=UPI000D207452|nr:MULTISPECIES: thiol reductant ABC exporter subunit CydD [unclassified Dietzia]AVZ38721.1 thiol reductant ABC exporter subunit CydD [Dietzia sp. JS16-p6b]QGW23817.1 ABC transporter permease/ATP-binding protein CydD [Dietzia sp. DQ12-45-1b]